MTTDNLRVAVVIPCHNEEATVAKVVFDFRASLPDAEIVVVDNASSDDTAVTARSAGATVVYESRRGKGYALVTGFRSVPDADIVVMVDGDDTYPAEDAAVLIEAVQRDADMAIGTRLRTPEHGAFPRGHAFGNGMFIFLVRTLFGMQTTDLLSGYRALTRRFIQVSPLIAQGFEIETELALQALAGGFRIAEVPIRYRARPVKGSSKLRTIRDGYRILLTLVAFLRDYRPLTSFGILGSLLLLNSFVLGLLAIAGPADGDGRINVVVFTLAVGLGVVAAICFATGIILSSIMRRATESAMMLTRREP